MKIRSIFLVFFLLIQLENYAQEQEIKTDSIEVYTITEQMPEFPGGEEKLFLYLGSNIRYPVEARDAGIQGVVYVNFVVYEDGSIKDVKVLRGIGGGCDEMATSVVKAMPKWKPGVQDGNNVRVSYNLPIRFTQIRYKDVPR